MGECIMCRRGRAGHHGGVQFTFSGQSQFVPGADGGWEIFLLSDGNLVFQSLPEASVDVFLVGGGGSGGKSERSYYGGGGGGAGYTLTVDSLVLYEGTQYEIEVGAGGAKKTASGTGNPGEATVAFGFTANGGLGGAGGYGGGGNGASGGGCGGYSTQSNWKATDGAVDGNNAANTGSTIHGGTGQGSTTRAFGDPDGTIYACGGGGGAGYTGGSSTSYGYQGKGFNGAGNGGYGGSDGGDGDANTGCGGGGSSKGTAGGAGGSGIVIIRNHRA